MTIASWLSALVRERFVAGATLVFALLAFTNQTAYGDPVFDSTESLDVSPPRGEEREGLEGSDVPLALAPVLASVDRHFPTLRALRSEQDARRGDLLSAQGRFDLGLEARGDWQPEGFYESRGGSLGIDAPTRLWGARFGAGYRIGRGGVPSYDGGRLTDDAGEIALRVEVPLLRGGATDPNRTGIGLAQVELDRLSPRIQVERLERIREASYAYWSWVATGRRLEVAEQLLAVASARQDQIAKRVERGAEPRIDLADNERLIVERRVALRGAQRDFEQAALRLGLFHRDEDGHPVVSGRDALPADFPAEAKRAEAELDRDLARAREGHPLLADFAFEREALELKLAQARNDRLPRLDVRVEGSQDLGDARPGIDQAGTLSAESRSSTEIKAGLRFQLPVQQRQARGKAAAAQARLGRVAAREQWMRERVIAEARAAWSALRAAFDQTEEARENVRLAEVLRAAENRRFGLGRSNLIDVNIREIQAATAARELVNAQASYFIALADYRARVGLGAPELSP